MICSRCKQDKNVSEFYINKLYKKRGRSYQCNSCHTIQTKEYRIRTKNIVFSHYKNKCACCGVDDVRFLTVDHVNSDGYMEKKRKWRGGHLLYRKVIREGLPDTYQLLCWNCNMAKSLYGVCPHKSDNTHP